jgi:hypothetical protein
MKAILMLRLLLEHVVLERQAREFICLSVLVSKEFVAHFLFAHWENRTSIDLVCLSIQNVTT